MSYRMYVYDMGIVDFYSGMMPLLDYIKLSYQENINEMHMGSPILSYRQLKGFLINCFMEVMCIGRWDGDIRGLDEIAISAIPRPTPMEPYKILVFKQDNNGESFCVSEFKLHYNNEDEEFDIEMLSTGSKNIYIKDLMGYYYHCFDLVEKLFTKALGQWPLSLSYLYH